MKEELREFGLSEKEADVYLAALKIGECTAQRISMDTGLRRSTTYDILESLKKKGLISSFTRDKKYYFLALDPKEIIKLLKDREENIKKAIPALSELRNSATERPRIEVFEGVRGISSLLEYIYNEKEILIYGSAKKASEALKHIPESLARRRVENKILLRAVFERSDEATFRVRDKEIAQFTKMRFLDSMKSLPSVTFIAGSQVAMITLGAEIIGVHMIDKNISSTQKLVFESLWSSAER